MKEDSLEISKYIQLAKKNQKEGRLKQANEIYKNLINKKIYTYELLISYGLFNKEINNLIVAKNLFTLAIKKYPLLIKSYILLAEIFRIQNKFNNAYEILMNAKKVEKDNADVDYNLSILFKTNKLYKEALIHINNALNNSPKIDLYKILKADILIDNFQNQKAEKVLGNLILDKNSNLYFQKELLFSRIFINQRDYVEAENTLLKLKTLFNNKAVLLNKVFSFNKVFSAST